MATKKAVEGAELIKELQRLELRPNDVIVAKTEMPMRPEGKVWLTKELRRLFPEHRVVVVDGPVELMAIGEDGATE